MIGPREAFGKVATGAWRLLRAAAFALAAGGAAAATAPGTVITNEAFGSAEVGPLGSVNIRSAPVTVTVGALPARFAAVLDPNHQVEGDPGGTYFLRHTLTNRGETSDNFSVAAIDLANGSWAYQSVTLFLDANDDGRPDSDTPLSGLHPLAPGEVLRFVARLVVPANVPLKTQNDVRVTATSVGGALIAPVVDRVIIPDRVIARDCGVVTKLLSREVGPSPAGPITVTLTYSPCEKARSRAVITDRLPKGMRYIANSGRWSETASASAPLTDSAANEREGKGPSKLEYDFGASVPNAVHIVVHNIPPHVGGIITFDVEIEPGIEPGTVIPNYATYTYYDDRGEPFGHDSSNIATYRVTGKTDFELTGDRLPTAAPGSTVVFTNVLTNKGDAADTYDITLSASTFPAGTVLTLLKPDGTTSLADSNGNGVPDTGVVAPGASYRILVRAQIPETAKPGSYQVTKIGRSGTITSLTRSADDLVDAILARCAVTLEPDQSARIGYGQRITYTHFLTNRGNCDETVTAQADYLSNDRSGWGTSVFIDRGTAGGGSIPGAIDPTDTPLGPGWTRALLPGETVRVLVEVRAPALDPAAQAAAKSGAVAKTQVTNLTRIALTSVQSGTVRVLDTTIVDSTISSDQPPGAPDNIIRNHTDPQHTKPTLWAIIGAYLYLKADAKICNGDPGAVDRRPVIIRGPNGEREFATATETGPNTGIFTVDPFPVRKPPVTPGNGILEGQVDDTYDIEILDCGRRVSTIVTLMEAISVVFDSQTNEPVAGALVTIVTAVGNQCSNAAFANGTGAAAPMVSSQDGRFTLPPLPRGEYCLVVAPPNGYRFASQVPWPQLPQGRNVVVSGLTSGPSYGGVFQADGETAFAIDIPVDPIPRDGLFVQKSASRAVAELGDTVEYVVRVKNGTGAPLDRGVVSLADELPAGFAYVPGSARRDGRTIEDPAAGPGRRLTLSLGSLRRDEQVEVSYRVRLGPGALQGDGVNRVQATYVANGVATHSNIATARVRVVAGVFTDKGYVLGRVFLDCNANGVVDPGEAGVPGVRMVLEDGTYAITDGEGKYSFYGLHNRTHVLKLDGTTLPAGAAPTVSSHRNLGDGSSRIVDLKSGELHRGDFALRGCTDAILSDVRRRAARAAEHDEVAAMASSPVSTEARVVTDPRAQAAAGVVKLQPGAGLGGAIPLPGFAALAPETRPALPSPAPGLPHVRDESATGAHTETPLEDMMLELDNTLAFLGYKDGDAVATSQVTLRVKGVAGTTFVLLVNGNPIGETQVGKRSVLEAKQLQAWEYFGVNLRAGENELVVRQLDSFGNARGEARLRLRAPGSFARLVMDLPPGGGVADGRTPVPVVVRVLDAEGTAVVSRVSVTLVASAGTWKEADLDPERPGLQVMVEGGRGEFLIVPPIEPQSATLQASSGEVKVEARLDFLPELRSLIASGLVEGIVNFRRGGQNPIQPAAAGDAFERELRALSREFDGGKGHAAARTAFYLKGKIRGDYLLTAAYDSDKDTRERLFRDIQPDEFYPVYGDSAVRGFDAQSTSKLYVRIDNKRSYLLWGDFTTQSTGDVRKLSNYSRSLTGLKHHFENERVSFNAFASRDSTRQVIEELRANGTSGPYQVGTAGALVNSEKVEIVTRDRDQPSLILSTVPMSRFSDYEIEVLTGRILFKAPVPSVDRNLNPVFIRVTYEVDQGGEKFWVAGVDAQVKLGGRVEVGGTFVKDRNPLLPFTLAGANMTVRLGESTYVIGEVASTESGLDSASGDAARIEVKHQSRALRAQGHVSRSDASFNNPGAYLGQGRNEAGFKLEYKLADRWTMRGDGLRTEDALNDSVREGVLASLQYQVADRLTVELGVRHARETGVTSPIPPVRNPDGSISQPVPLPDEVTALRARVTAGVPGVENASVFAEAEVDVKDADRRMLAAGGEYRLQGKGRLYARHEFISSLTGPYGLNAQERQNTTALGADTEYMKDGRLFSEYRVRDAIYGGDVEAAVGLKNLWSIAPGLRLGTTFERVQALSGSGQNENTAVALALEYTGSPLWKGSTRLEARDGTAQDSLLFTVGMAARLSRDWTLLARNAYSLLKNSDGTRSEVDRLQAGVAFRDHETNRWNALARVESRFEHNPTGTLIAEAIPVTGAPTLVTPLVPTQSQKRPDLKVTTHIVSLHADWQPRRPFLVSGRYAAKWSQDRSSGFSTRTFTQAAGVRATWEFAPRWDLGFVTSVLVGHGAEARHYALGLELGYLLATNLWVSAGYNFSGYREADLAGGDHTAKGAYVRLRYKFDESVLPQAEARK